MHMHHKQQRVGSARTKGQPVRAGKVDGLAAVESMAEAGMVGLRAR
jgi:hypothetical protein